MELKKNPKVNLEKVKGVFFLSGIITALVVTILLFNWTTTDAQIEELISQNDENIDVEQMKITQKEEKKPEPKQQEKKVSDIIKIVDDETIIEDDFNFDMEADDETSMDFIDTDFEDNTDEGEIEEVFVIVEQMPEFPGGEVALRNYIAENVDYPVLAQENDIQGTVFIRFIVTKSGSVKDVQIIRGYHELLDEEALRVVKTLPNFKPGSQRGKAVSVWYTVPITFELNN